MNDRLASFFQDLDRAPDLNPDQLADCVQRADWIRGATKEEARRLFQTLASRGVSPAPHQDRILQVALQHIMARQRGQVKGISAMALDSDTLESVARLYRDWPPAVGARSQLLLLLSASQHASALRWFAEAVVTNPPEGETWVGPAFAPLFQHRAYRPEDLFPRLLDGLRHPSAAAAILDLANFLTREGLVSEHPAQSRTDQLISLLAGLVGHLGQLESREPESQAALQTITRQVSAGISLGVSLCDALALIEDRAAVGKLYQAMEVGHRRLRTEAAWALARMGESAGTDALIELAREPVARLRVLAYAEELGITERIDDRYRTDVSRAEAELALWLSSPNQMGLPPSACELVERRRMAWPSFDDPVDCFLFRFSYAAAEQGFCGLGLAGPTTHAFTADLSELPIDDVFAAFAGWHVTHEDIFELDVDDWGDAERIRAARLERHLHDLGYDALRPLMLASFFGDAILVAEATQEGHAGMLAGSLTDLCWIPRGRNARPVGPVETLSILRGRRLLRAFTPGHDPPE